MKTGLGLHRIVGWALAAIVTFKSGMEGLKYPFFREAALETSIALIYSIYCLKIKFKAWVPNPPLERFWGVFQKLLTISMVYLLSFFSSNSSLVRYVFLRSTSKTPLIKAETSISEKIKLRQFASQWSCSAS